MNRDFELNSLTNRVKQGKSKLMDVLRSIDESKAVLVDVPSLNEVHVTRILRDKIGLPHLLSQSDIARFYENDEKHNQYASDFSEALEGKAFRIDYKSIPKDKAYLQDEYQEGIKGSASSQSFDGDALKAIEDFENGLS